MSVTFDQVFDRLMIHEGGYVSAAQAQAIGDPGGETNLGISRRSYPQEDIAGMTRERAKVLFRRDFWNRINADKLHDGVAWQLADLAYNSGPETAVRLFQRALGVSDDGHWGPISQAAADAMSESDQIMRLNAVRLDWLTYRSNWANASRGWSRRIAKNLFYGSEDS